MAIFIIRFDLRNPAIAGTRMADRYTAALEMAEWADRVGFFAIALSEHHGSPDGYLPSPLTMAAAIAARTSRARIMITALTTPFHNPLRLAEDGAVLDHLSRGRVEFVLGAGYVPSEFEMFGIEPRERPRRVTEAVTTLRQAWTGEPFEFRGRTVRVTPAPLTPGGPRISLGGSSAAAARRAARLGVGFTPTDAATWEFYREEMLALGHPDPGPGSGGGRSGAFLHVTKDVEAAWERIAPYALHETNAYGAWAAAAAALDGTGSTSTVFRPVESADELRDSGQYRVVTPARLVEELSAQGPFAVCSFNPMMGGIPPELAWESLRLLEHEVIPKL
ncbi:MAG: LLM class flavin-dependent oxidoreductase [Frankia sp.]|nr:LLM class flavin-dependent oxidoreductase [Frankia sp.]